MNVINKIIEWLGYTLGSSNTGDTVVYSVAGVVIIIMVMFIVKLISRILNITFFRGKENE